MTCLTARDFTEVFGVPMNSLCSEIIETKNFRYRNVLGRERDSVILDVLNTPPSNLCAVGQQRRDEWENGWRENLNAFAVSHKYEDLIPGYYRRGIQIMRFRGDYIKPESPHFETSFLAVLLAYLGSAYLTDDVYEFGCGPAHNLVKLARLFPEKRYCGLDWSSSSQQIISQISFPNIVGANFDMFQPDNSFKIVNNGTVFTIGAMEQLGTQFEPFLNYVLSQPIGCCVHIEPVYELYQKDVLFDELARRYSDARGYLKGYLPRLQQLELEGIITIEKIQKHIGGSYQDSWTSIIWKKKQESKTCLK